MTHAVDVSQPLSPAEMEVIHGVSNMDFAHKDQLGFSHYWVPNLLPSETNTESTVCHHFQGTSANHLVEGCLHWTISIMEGVALCSQWNDTYPGCEFVFLPLILPKTTTHRFPKCFIQCYSFPHEITFYHGNYSLSDSLVLVWSSSSWSNSSARSFWRLSCNTKCVTLFCRVSVKSFRMNIYSEWVTHGNGSSLLPQVIHWQNLSSQLWALLI